MKKLFTMLLIAAAISSPAFAQTKAHDVARFDKEHIDMGTLSQGVPQPVVFTLTNISKAPLIIEKAMPSCGCTMSEYTKTPILPGKTGTVKGTYNAAAAGKFTKTISVKFAGIDDITPLEISGVVEAAKVAATPSKG